jgi:hypothetical protein
MAVNTSKTKFIVFRTWGKRIEPQDCRLLFNNNETGLPEDPALVSEITRIHNEGEEKSFKLLGVLLDKYLYGTARSRIFYRTPAGYTAKKKTRRKRNRGCQGLLSVAHQPLPPPLSSHTPCACCIAWGCVIRAG